MVRSFKTIDFPFSYRIFNKTKAHFIYGRARKRVTIWNVAISNLGITSSLWDFWDASTSWLQQTVHRLKYLNICRMIWNHTFPTWEMRRELGCWRYYMTCAKIKEILRSPRRGIEPRSPAWQAGILTTILPRKWCLNSSATTIITAIACLKMSNTLKF